MNGSREKRFSLYASASAADLNIGIVYRRHRAQSQISPGSTRELMKRQAERVTAWASRSIIAVEAAIRDCHSNNSIALPISRDHRRLHSATSG